MTARETPVFIGPPQGTLTNLAVSTAQTVTIFTAGADGSQLTGLNLYELAGTGSGTIKFLLFDGGNSRYVGKVATTGTDDTPTNLLTSTIFPGLVDDNNPSIALPANWTLKAEIPSIARVHNISAVGGNYTA